MSTVCVGIGSYFPEHKLTNDEIERSCSSYNALTKGYTVDAWARRKHGGVVRHRAAAHEATSDLALEASRRALSEAGIGSEDIDLIVMATISGDQRWPETAALLQRALGTRAKCMQVNSACSGFIDTMLVTHGLLERGAATNALVVTAECFRGLFDPEDFLPHTVFGDAAAAMVLSRRPELTDHGVRCIVTGSDGRLGDYVMMKAGGSKYPISSARMQARENYVRFRFSEIGVWAVERFVRGAREALARAGLDARDIRCVIPHQASSTLIERVAKVLELPLDAFVVRYPDVGNTSSASIPSTLDWALRSGRIAHGDMILMPAAGAGMAWGALIYRWYDYRRQAS